MRIVCVDRPSSNTFVIEGDVNLERGSTLVFIVRHKRVLRSKPHK